MNWPSSSLKRYGASRYANGRGRDLHECRLRHGVLKLFEGDRHEWLFGPDEQRRPRRLRAGVAVSFHRATQHEHPQTNFRTLLEEGSVVDLFTRLVPDVQSGRCGRCRSHRTGNGPIVGGRAEPVET